MSEVDKQNAPLLQPHLWQEAREIFIEIGKPAGSIIFVAVWAKMILEAGGATLPSWANLNSWPHPLAYAAVAVAMWGLVAFALDFWDHVHNSH